MLLLQSVNPWLLVVIVLLPMIFGGDSSSSSNEDSAEDENDLVGLLKQVRQRLASRKVFRSIHDDFNEQRWLEVSDAATEGRAISDLPDTSLSAEQRIQLLDAINNKRRSEGASDMYMIHWNDKLAKLAQLWANKCEFRHGWPIHNSDELGMIKFGATLWAFQGEFDANSIIENWYKDKANFDPVTHQCNLNQPCGGYRQLVTAFTTDVGCGISTCTSVAGLSNAKNIVCYFGPAGNVMGDLSFNVNGPACTACKYGQFYCNNELCDKTCTSPSANCVCKAECKNCGTQTADCSCTCKQGSTGPNCADLCRDKDERCGQKRNGWLKPWCTKAFDFVLEKCPKMCGLCSEGNPCGRNDDLLHEFSVY